MKQDNVLDLAKKDLLRCNKCEGYVHLSYEPGVTFSVCMMGRDDCPCRAASPDFSPWDLVKRINTKIKNTK